MCPVVDFVGEGSDLLHLPKGGFPLLRLYACIVKEKVYNVIKRLKYQVVVFYVCQISEICGTHTCTSSIVSKCQIELHVSKTIIVQVNNE